MPKRIPFFLADLVLRQGKKRNNLNFTTRWLFSTLLTLLGSSVASFFVHFLGSEGTARISAPFIGIGLTIILICFIFLFRFWHYRKKGKGLTLKLFRIFILLTKAGNMNMLLPARMHYYNGLSCSYSNSCENGPPYYRLRSESR